MAINPSQFHKSNVADTCAVWNILSSTLLFCAARDAGCTFCCTSYVIYECLHKPRKKHSAEDGELQVRLMRARENKHILTVDLSIGDLQEVTLLENRKRLSKGELASIAFAMKTSQSFITDDQKARKLALTSMPSDKVQTTPHLFGWLMFNQHLSDGNKDEIIRDHRSFHRPLSKFFEAIYIEALRCRSMTYHALATAQNAQA